MGNVNNCLSNPYEYEVIKIQPEKNFFTDKTFNNSNSKNISHKYYSYNKQNLDIINEEDIQETNSKYEKQPRDRYLHYFYGPNIENKYNINFNNNLKRNKIQGIKIRDNNILFNSIRKDNINQKSNELNNNNNETNKYITSLEESDNLIVLDYNKQEGANNNSIKNYSNNEYLTPKEKNMKNNNNTYVKNKNNLIQNLIQNNINQFKKENENITKNNLNNNININNNSINKPNKSNNIFIKNIPYIKPRFNSNYINNNNKITNIGINNKKNGINKIKNVYYDTKNKKPISSNLYNNEIKESSYYPNTNIHHNKSYENNILTNKNNIQYLNNHQYYQNDQINFISDSKKSNFEKNKNEIPNKRPYIRNSQETNNQLQYMNNNIMNERQILRNNKTNLEINKEIINRNEIENNILSKSQELYQNKQENINPDENILYQSAILDNIPEDQNILIYSSSYENNENNIIKNIQNEEINPQLYLQNIEYNLGNENEFSKFSNPNEQIIIRQPIIQKEYDYNEIINQQTEQEKKGPEYEQTQPAKEEENEINDLDNKIIEDNEHKEPRDKDSECEINPKMKEKQFITKEYQEINNYQNQNLVPYSEDRITFNQNDNNYYINQKNNFENENKKEMNKIKSKKKILDENKLKKTNDIQKENKNTQDNQFFAIPLTPTKPIDEVSPYNKKIYNKIEIHSSEEEIINNDENIFDNNENNNIELEELECPEFEDFSPNAWEKFYQNERFFKFPKEGIIHDQIIRKNDEIYKGDINNNKEKHGFGKYISNTIKRIGMWRRDKFNGWGREIKENGDIYEGKYVNGQLNGKGIYKNKNNKTTYIGDFLNSKRHGKGELYSNDFHYKGDFYDNKFEGKGKIEIYKEGEYEGDFKDNLFEGKGMLKWKDGRYYFGELSKGKMNGYGEETDKDGNIYKGNFVDGVKEGHGQFISLEGKIFDVEFRNGKFFKDGNNLINNEN